MIGPGFAAGGGDASRIRAWIAWEKRPSSLQQKTSDSLPEAPRASSAPAGSKRLLDDRARSSDPGVDEAGLDIRSSVRNHSVRWPVRLATVRKRAEEPTGLASGASSCTGSSLSRPSRRRLAFQSSRRSDASSSGVMSKASICEARRASGLFSWHRRTSLCTDSGWNGRSSSAIRAFSCWVFSASLLVRSVSWSLERRSPSVWGRAVSSRFSSSRTVPAAWLHVPLPSATKPVTASK